MTNDLTERLEYDLEQRGYKKGSHRFKTALRVMKIDNCKERNGFDSCSSCTNYMFCTLLEEHNLAVRLGGS